MSEDNEKHLANLIRHITLVQDACKVIGDKLIASGETEFGKALIANSFLHDNSKFYGIEWDYLHKVDQEIPRDKLDLAIHQHITTNKHHPEYWGGIGNMPDIYIAEFVADTYARSSEFGTDYRTWIKDVASKRFNFSLKSNTYKSIKKYTDLLLGKPFK